MKISLRILVSLGKFIPMASLRHSGRAGDGGGRARLSPYIPKIDSPKPFRPVPGQQIKVMWIPRTQEEQNKWLARTHSQARSFAILIGVSVFVGVTLAMSFGISLVPAGVMFMGFSPRPLGFTSAVVIGALIGLGVARDVRRAELKKNLSLTVCPRCGKMGQLNEGEKCRCGSSFVKTSKVRWVDDAIDETAPQNGETSASNPAEQ